MTRVRIQIRKDKPFVTKIQEFFNRSSSNKISLKEFKEERKKLDKELEESSQGSKEEISKILKKRKVKV